MNVIVLVETTGEVTDHILIIPMTETETGLIITDHLGLAEANTSTTEDRGWKIPNIT